MQLGELTQFDQQCLDVTKVLGCCMPHPSRMTLDVTAPQAPIGYGAGRSQQKRRSSGSVAPIADSARGGVALLARLDPRIVIAATKAVLAPSAAGKGNRPALRGW